MRVWVVVMLATAGAVAAFSSCTLDPSAGAPKWGIAETAAWQIRSPSRPAARSDLSASEHLGGTASAAFGHGLLHVALPATFLLAVGIRTYLRRRARLDAKTVATGDLRPGRATIHGVIEPDDAADPLVLEIAVQQRSTTTTTKGRPITVWRECDRSVRVKPFVIRRADGVRVRVESDGAIHSELPFDRTDNTSRSTRTRFASAKVGKEIYVTGAVQLPGAARGAAYRAPSASPQITAARISDSPPGMQDLEVSRLHGGFAAAAVWLWLVIAGFTMPSFEILTVDGERTTGEVVDASTWQERVKPKNGAAYLADRYAVKVRVSVAGEKRILESRCDAATFDCAVRGTCAQLPFVVSRHVDRVRALGDRPTVHGGGAIVSMIFFTMFAIVYGVVLVFGVPSRKPQPLVESG